MFNNPTAGKREKERGGPAPKVRVTALGGLGQIGTNIMTIECAGDMIVIDVGLMFPDEKQKLQGGELVIPKFDHILENKDKLRGIFLTHGHEDHTGALPFLIKELGFCPPVYGTRLTLGLAGGRVREGLGSLQEVFREAMREVDESSIIEIGEMQVEFLPVCHSVPDGVAIAVRTPQGILLHTGDFKIDHTPIDGRRMDFGRLTALGEEGIRLLMADSTNAETPGVTLSEKEVRGALDWIFKYARKRIVVACFASHIHRIQQVIDTAVANGRRIAVVGRSMEQNVRIAKDLGYLDFPDEWRVNRKAVDDLPPEDCVVLCTGSQGEPMAALTRIASGDHQHLSVHSGDTVVLAATPVPGNEKSVGKTINMLFAEGAKVFYEGIVKSPAGGHGVHVSGHASREDLKLVHSMTRPEFFMPIHGEDRHRYRHADLAQDMGMPGENVIMAENGDIIELDEFGAHIAGRVESGHLLVDGLGLGEPDAVVLRDRARLSQDGYVIVVAAVDVAERLIATGPDIKESGFLYEHEDEILAEATAEAETCLANLLAKGNFQVDIAQDHVKSVLSKHFYSQTRRRPVIETILFEV